MGGKTVFKARLTGAEIKQYLAERKDNIAKRRACPGHRFPPLVAEWDHEYECLVCGATAKSEYIIDYCEGYRAAGGNPRDVCANVEGDV